MTLIRMCGVLGPSTEYFHHENKSVCFFRDRLRTTTNVLGDSIGAGIVEHLSRHELCALDAEIGNSVVEENETKKSYQLISQESESENAKIPDSETKM